MKRLGFLLVMFYSVLLADIDTAKVDYSMAKIVYMNATKDEAYCIDAGNREECLDAAKKDLIDKSQKLNDAIYVDDSGRYVEQFMIDIKDRITIVYKYLDRIEDPDKKNLTTIFLQNLESLYNDMDRLVLYSNIRAIAKNIKRTHALVVYKPTKKEIKYLKDYKAIVNLYTHKFLEE